MDTNILLILIFFTPVLLAIVPLLIIALRGRTRRSQPLCGACGQGLGDASLEEHGLCPNCRAYLTQKKTVKLAREGTRWGVLVVVIVLLLLPVGSFFGFDLAQTYYRQVINPKGLTRYESTSSLIQQAVNNLDGAESEWRELARRYENGRISYKQAWQIVDLMAKRMNQQKPGGWNSYMPWAEVFLKKVFDEDKLEIKRLRQFVKAFQGTSLTLRRMPRKVSQGYYLHLGFIKSGRKPIPGPVQVMWKFESVRIGGEKVPIANTWRSSISFRCDINPGDYKVHLEVDLMLIREKHLLGFDPASMSSDDWPPALDQWTRKVTAPLKVVAR